MPDTVFKSPDIGMPEKSWRLSAGLLLSVLPLCLAFASLAWPDRLNRYFTDFHGYAQRITLSLPASETLTADIRLILPAFDHCTESCPANLMLSKQLLADSPSDIGLVVLSVQTERDATALLQRYAEVTGQQPALLDKDYPASWSLLARYEQVRQLQGKAPQHAGHLYLYQHSSQTLLTYPVPDAGDILRDISRLKTGVKHG